MAEPRGIRNNNPGNLVKTDSTWLGEIAGEDQRFATFEKPEYGIRAMGKQLSLYQSRDGLRTVDEIIGKWAPPSENESTVQGTYQASVAKALGVSPADPLDLSDPKVMKGLVTAMLTVENGKNPYDDAVIESGLAMMPLSQLQDQGLPTGAQPNVRAKMDQDYTDTVEGLWARLRDTRARTSAVPAASLTPVSAQGIAAGLSTPDVLPSERAAHAREVEQAWADGITFLDKTKAAFDETTIPLIARQQDKPWNYEDPNFDSFKAYSATAGQYTDVDDIERLLGAKNQATFDWLVGDIKRKQDNMRVLSTGTLAGTLGASLVAGGLDPMTYVTGIGGMKAAALMGKSGYAYYALGGALGNVGYDVVRASVGGDVSGTDLIASAALGAGLGVIGYRFGGAADDALLARQQKVAEAAAQERAKDIDQAVTELGPRATPEEVSARADDIWRERTLKNMDIALAKPDAANMLIPETPAVEVFPVDPSLPGPATDTPLLTGVGVTEAAPEVLPPEGGRIANLARRAWDFIRGEPAADPDGLDFIPSGEVRESVRRILKHAEAGVAANPIDQARLQVLSDNLSNSAVFSGVRDNLGSTGIALLRSKSPVAKWWAMQALENTTGAYRTSTVSITKYQLEHMYMGDAKNDLEVLFNAWAREQNTRAGIKEFFTGESWREFGDQIFRYREGVRNGVRVVPAGESQLIRKASELLDRQYDMMRRHQRRARVSGFGNLPSTSEGYQPWAISPKKWKALSEGKQRAYTRALSEEVQAKHGWDKEFSDFFARQYVDQVNKWVNGGVHASAMPNESAVGVLKKALEARGLSAGEVLRRLDEFTKGGRKQTKGRLQRDLLTPYDDGEGGYLTLADIMETDPATLLQRQARRISGEVALARHGVTSDAEIQMIRTAMEHTKATPKELEAFDQTVAELLGGPFADATPLWIDNLRAATSLVQLGGMGFAQLSETANAISAFGVATTMRKVPQFGRLVREVKMLARGEKVDNPVLNGIDEFVGNIGMHNYKNTFAHQMGDPSEVVYGRDSIGTIGKLIRGGQYLQGKLSMWRIIHAVQQRAVAEMAINKGLRYIREGKDTPALRDMGINEQLAARVKAELRNVADFDELGNVTRYEPQKGSDTQAIKEFNDSIMRGVGQIVQETYVGETGKWAHSGYLKFLTQFRTYSITSFEKQAVRQFRTHGTMKAFGILLASISVSAPIYAARTLLSAALLPAADREEFMEKRMAPAELGIAALGYTALGGWARDMIDMGGSAMGFDMPGSPRVPQGGFVSSFVPGLSLIEDIQTALSSAVPHVQSDGTIAPRDLSKTLRVLPGGRLPFIRPLIEALNNDN